MNARCEEPTKTLKSSNAAARRPVRVAWLQPVVAPYRVALVDALSQLPGIELVIYTGQAAVGVSVADASDQVAAPVVSLRNLRAPRSAKVLYTMGWTRILRDRVDVVLTTEASHNLVNWLLLATRRMAGHKVTVVGHIRPLLGQSVWVCRLRRLLVRAADGVVAYTDAGRLQALAWRVPSNRVTVMDNAIDMGRIANADRGLQRNRRGGTPQETVDSFN